MKNLKIAKVRDLLKVTNHENGEGFAVLQDAVPGITSRYIKPDMLKTSLGEKIVVRNSVAEKLAVAQQKLSEIYRDYQLHVAYGYRTPEIQEQSYQRKRQELSRPDLSDGELTEQTHTFVAFPEVAGHPTGGAIDVTLINRLTGKELPMGCHISDFSKPELMATFATGLRITEKENRLLLHNLLKELGFAPFYGEWWHFSYGDREWAFFYDQPTSLYSPVSLDQLKKTSSLP